MRHLPLAPLLEGAFMALLVCVIGMMLFLIFFGMWHLPLAPLLEGAVMALLVCIIGMMLFLIFFGG